jgi:hypothetical protein
MDETTVHRGRDFGTGMPSESRQENQLKSSSRTSQTQERGRYQGTGVPTHLTSSLDDNKELKGSSERWPTDNNQDNEQK